MSKEMWGTGTTMLRGRIWWIQYSHHGHVYRESSYSRERKVAVKLLKQRLGEVAQGRVIGPTAEKVMLGEMTHALLVDQELKGNRTNGAGSVKHLHDHFGRDARAIDITSDRVAAYAQERRRVVSGASVNRELAALRRAFVIAVQSKRLSHDHVPTFPKLEESKPRRGFIEPATFAQLVAALPENLKDCVTYMYHTGWRIGAMRSLTWADVELERDADGTIVGGTIHLREENAKNNRASSLRITGALVDVIRRAADARDLRCPAVFQRWGQPVGDFRKPWRHALRAVGLDEKTRVHDLRRSCARNLVRAGVSENIAMAITGHKTRTMFDRYNIVAESDLEAAMEKVSAYVAGRSNEKPKVVALKETASKMRQKSRQRQPLMNNVAN